MIKIYLNHYSTLLKPKEPKLLIHLNMGNDICSSGVQVSHTLFEKKLAYFLTCITDLLTFQRDYARLIYPKTIFSITI